MWTPSDFNYKQIICVTEGRQRDCNKTGSVVSIEIASVLKNNRWDPVDTLHFDIGKGNEK